MRRSSFSKSVGDQYTAPPIIQFGRLRRQSNAPWISVRCAEAPVKTERIDPKLEYVWLKGGDSIEWATKRASFARLIQSTTARVSFERQYLGCSSPRTAAPFSPAKGRSFG